MNLKTGNQLRAARSLIDMSQGTLADLAGVNVNTIRSMEARGANTLVSSLDTVLKIQDALKDKGVSFLSSGDIATGQGACLANL